MTLDDYAGALHFLETTPRLARFVATVGLHGGFCQRRQWMAYTQTTVQAAAYALDRLVRRGFMTRTAFAGNGGFLYRLVSRPVYRTLGFSSVRWYLPPPGQIARRLMVLDVALAHPHADWFVHPSEKVRLFRDQFGVAPADLPQRSRRVCGRRPRVARPERPAATHYFPDEWPIFRDASGRVHFVVLAVGSSPSAFSRFLTEHRRLLAQLPAWTILAACPAGHFGLPVCQAAFDRVYRTADRTAGPRTDGSLDADLARYFACRLSLEANEPAPMSAVELDEYREARMRYIGAEIDQQFRAWKARMALAARLRPVVAPSDELPNPVAEGRGEFRTYRLPATYRQFGELAGDL